MRTERENSIAGEAGITYPCPTIEIADTWEAE
jgi:hypothetical protein